MTSAHASLPAVAENAYKLCPVLVEAFPQRNVYAIWCSSPNQRVLFHEHAGRPSVMWDYHVFNLVQLDNESLVFDLDSSLDFPCSLISYLHITFSRHVEDMRFRLIPAHIFLKEFASDRSHMRRPDGSYISPPPPYPSWKNEKGETMNINVFLNMSTPVGPGRLLTLTELTREFQGGVATAAAAHGCGRLLK